MDTEPERVKARLNKLTAYHSKKPYQKQRSSLQKQLESYLWSLAERKTLKTANPNDIISFLIWRDKFGKTVLHTQNCGQPSGAVLSCQCLKVLSAGTVDNNIGKLRAIFKDMGRGVAWNDDLQTGNPAAHHTVNRYKSLVLEEQTIARTFPFQAIPIFLDKLKLLCTHLRSMVQTPLIKPSQRYILARDLAFFSVDFFSGDRASDLGRVKSSDILVSADGKGVIVNQVFGKTLRGNGKNVFGLKCIPNSSFCPVTNIRYYVALAKKMSICLSPGYLFRVTDQHGNIKEDPFTGSAVANRLRKHLQDLNIDDGETMHSFRGGCSITLALLGTSCDDVAKHVGWKSSEMTSHYCQIDKVMSNADTSSTLASLASNPLLVISTAERVGNEFRTGNYVSGYSPLI